MMSLVHSACPIGVEALPVTVEVDVRPNHLRVSIVGLPDTATRESKDRLIPAISNSGFALADDDIVINLGPADLRKEGPVFDLAMAVGILISKGVIPHEAVEGMMLLGELSLNGRLRPIRCALAAAECARTKGFKALVVPRSNGREAELVSGLPIYEVGCLAELVHFFRGKVTLRPMIGEDKLPPRQPGSYPDMADVRGNALPRRAMEIAAAGFHNLLMYGPPGSGKSMLGKRLPGILPSLSPPEVLEVTRIHCCFEALPEKCRAITLPPFRSPHHTASPIALVGGGSQIRAGEVTRAHRGVLFLDEFPEYPRTVLEVLRQPLEDGVVTISRASSQVTFPANFLLVAAMNPCPCGWSGDRKNRCNCTQQRIAQYRGRISGPLLDRIDLHVEVPSLSVSTLRRLPPSENSEVVRRRVQRARSKQLERFGDPLMTNSRMSQQQLDRCCELPNQLAELFETQVEERGCSKRVHDKVLRVARTIADLAESETIQREHLMEALGYRALDFHPRVVAPVIQEVVS